MKKKLLTACILVACAVVLVVGSVLTTMALLTSSDAVTNTFTYGNVQITMDEAKVTIDGELDGDSRVESNTYHLVPGNDYIKDPTIHITSSEKDNMYLFVKSRNEIRSAEDGNNGGASLSMRQQMINNGWVEYVRSGDGVEIVWVYGTRNTETGAIEPTPVNKASQQMKDGTPISGVSAGDFRLCENFTIHQDAKVNMYSSAIVKFTAFAIQDSGFAGETNEAHALTQAAWNAIKSAYPYDVSIIAPKNPYTNDETVDAHAPVAGVQDPVEIPINPTPNP